MDLLAQLHEWTKINFWRKRDHRSSSAGVTDAGLPVVLDATGKLGASLLDDADILAAMSYATGTWTPSIAFGGASAGITYVVRTGRYIRIGSLVLAHCYIYLSSKGTSTGAATITNLPIAAVNTTSSFQTAALRANTLSGITGHLQCYILPGSTTITLEQLGTGAVAALNDTNFANASDIIFSTGYEV